MEKLSATMNAGVDAEMNAGMGGVAVLETVGIEEILGDVWTVEVWNDDVNSFEHVIRAFSEVLSYTVEMAERKALQIHLNGAAEVWVGGREECEHRASLLRDGYRLDARLRQ